MEFDEEDYLQLSGIQHYLFCRRQWAIIHIEQQWAENEKTIDGMFFHQNAHDQNKDERRGDTLIRHALSVHSSSLGLSGQCDVVEFHRSEEGIQLAGETGRWKIYPVEYKRGHEKPDNCDAAQLCAQAMCLEEMYCCDIDSGALFYGEKRHRQIVCMIYSDMDTRLRQNIRNAVIPAPFMKYVLPRCRMVNPRSSICIE